MLWQWAASYGAPSTTQDWLWARAVGGLDELQRDRWERARGIWLLDHGAVRVHVDVGVEVGGQWIADVRDLPGVMAYGATRADAIAQARVLALRALADQIGAGERPPLAAIQFVD